ncbi:MAG TPA: CPBP family intramembrane glutamic endopeptidase [Microlunatus sp.]|nr:CPBP family intramembrane glutamic endopeptidase [Microlunatus sp.]
MSTGAPDPTTTRPPPEGGWFRFGSELPVDLPETSGSAGSTVETWDPIPRFRPTSGAEAGTPYGPLLVPWGAHPPPPRPRRPRLPATPVGYLHLLRGPTRAWWRPLLSLVVLAAAFGLLTVPVYPITMAYGLLSGEATIDGVEAWLDRILELEGPIGPGGYLLTSLSLIVLIPAAMLSIWAAHRIRPGFLSSVAGHLRWRWLLRCAIVLAPLWVVYLAISTLVDPPQSGRPDQWWVLLVLALLLTPGQAAAEEYVFRGWVMQNVGAYLARPLVALVVSTAIGAAAFAAAHGSPDPWVLADLVLFAAVASVMTWRTGGLEAAIVMHTVNNIGVFVVTVTIGGWAEAFIGEETRGTPVAFAVSVVLHGIALALVWWQAERVGLDPWFRPAGSAMSTAGPGVAAAP